MTVKFKKTITGFIGRTDDVNNASKETFYMASLKAPISKENWTEAEKDSVESGKTNGVYVNSEYVRVEELIKVPYLVNKRTLFDQAATGDFANETQTDAEGEFYVHYHDSACVYHSEANELIDLKWAYDQPLDLKDLVKVCATDRDQFKTRHATNHIDLVNYKEYGLSFRFYLAKAPYITLGGIEGNTNKTDQQKFAEIDKAERIRACYQHACLKYVSNEKMNNQSLRARLGIEDKNYPMASRIIKDTLEAKLIKEESQEGVYRHNYIPYWA